MNKRPRQAFCAVLLALALAAPARADLTIQSRTTVNIPSLSKQSAQANTMMQMVMQQFGDTTEYIKNGKVRTDTAVMTIIIDRKARTMTLLNNTQKEYSVMPLTSAMMSRMPGSPGAGLASGKVKSYKLTDTGKTLTLLGHKARLYLLKLTTAGLDGVHRDVSAQMWIAQDLPAADVAPVNTLSASEPGPVHLKGIPLSLTMTIKGEPMGTMTITQKAMALSTKALPDSVFQVPSDYTKFVPEKPAAPSTPAH